MTFFDRKEKEFFCIAKEHQSGVLVKINRVKLWEDLVMANQTQHSFLKEVKFITEAGQELLRDPYDKDIFLLPNGTYLQRTE